MGNWVFLCNVIQDNGKIDDRCKVLYELYFRVLIVHFESLGYNLKYSLRQ